MDCGQAGCPTKGFSELEASLGVAPAAKKSAPHIKKLAVGGASGRTVLQLEEGDGQKTKLDEDLIVLPADFDEVEKKLWKKC